MHPGRWILQKLNWLLYFTRFTLVNTFGNLLNSYLFLTGKTAILKVVQPYGINSISSS